MIKCPYCNSVQFGTHITHQIASEETIQEFFNTGALESQQQYYLVCDGCGRPFQSVEEFHQDIREMLVIITGNSQGYKRKALKEYGLNSTEWIEKFDDGLLIIAEMGLAFITKEVYKQKEFLQAAFSGYKVQFQPMEEPNENLP